MTIGSARNDSGEWRVARRMRARAELRGSEMTETDMSGVPGMKAELMWAGHAVQGVGTERGGCKASHMGFRLITGACEGT